ncbi:MAG: TraR/DksA C4-type zinc finger protein, partial [Verrucomicrobiota bacterium]
VVLDAFMKKQKQKLLDLRDSLLDAMGTVTKDNLRAGSDSGDSSAFGMHQADAGSDAYDRDFALSLLSKEQDALYEIDEALERMEMGAYGICEISGKKIPRGRLEALPFARLTVECQAQVEKNNHFARGGRRQNVRSLFGLMDGGSDVEKAESED